MSLTCPNCGIRLGLELRDLGVAGAASEDSASTHIDAEPTQTALGGDSASTQTGAESAQNDAELTQNGNASLSALVVASKPLRARTKPLQRKARAYDRQGWESFWKAFPLKLDKGKAYDAFCAALDAGVDAERLTAGAAGYARYVALHPTQSVKFAQGWIHDERWTDELPLPLEVGEGPSYAEQKAARIAEEARAIQ
jgi:hypothetical protein